MARIIVGFGEHNGYRLQELPVSVHNELAVRYPLTITEDSSPEYDVADGLCFSLLTTARAQAYGVSYTQGSARALCDPSR